MLILKETPDLKLVLAGWQPPGYIEDLSLNLGYPGASMVNLGYVRSDGWLKWLYRHAEALMFTGRPYIVNAQALADSLVLSIGKEAVVGEIGRDPRLALRMLAGISRRLHGLVRDVQAYALHSGAQRVIGYLLRDVAAEESNSDEAFTVTLPVSKATIASRLSLTPEYFSRVLHELEAAGLVRIDKRDVHILDPKRLASYQAP